MECVLKSAVCLGESCALPGVVCIFFGQSPGGTATPSLLKLISLRFSGTCWYCEFKPQKIAGRTGRIHQFKSRGACFLLFPPSGNRCADVFAVPLWPGLPFYQSLRPQLLGVPAFCEGLLLLGDALSWASFLSMVHKIMVCLT